MTMRHYVFGYGSLICSESRARTARALGGSGNGNFSGHGEGESRGAIPVRLWNWKRQWNVVGRFTYLGIVPDDPLPTDTNGSGHTHQHNDSRTGSSCVGVLVPLPPSGNSFDDALSALDERESAYDRHQVDLGSISRVDSLLEGKAEPGACHNSDCYAGTFLDGSQRNDDTQPCVWVYVPKFEYRSCASPDHPILQSYVDVCLKGCVSISKAFAHEFVHGTEGWEGSCVSSDGDEKVPSKNGSAAGTSTPSWINDRSKPHYVRSDPEYSLEHAKFLDNLLGPLLLAKREG